MIGAYASAIVLVGASLVLGRAVLALCGQRESAWLAGPVGLAAILVVAGATIDLPGHATTTAVALAAILIAAVPVSGPTLLRLSRRRMRRRREGGSDGTEPGTAAPIIAGVLALLAASIPFAANGHVGILGVGLINDDMASHLLLADWLDARFHPEPVLIDQGYPLGPHALAAALAVGLGTDTIATFDGVTLALPVLTAVAAAGALGNLRPAPRVAAAVLVAIPYLAAAYLAQGAFKEPLVALLVLAFALLLPAATDARRALPLGLIAAGVVYTYSFPGLAWLAATLALWTLWTWWRGGDVRADDASTEQGAHAPPSRGRHRPNGYRRPASAAIVATLGLLLLTLPDWGRILDFADFRALDPDRANDGGLGNLRHQLSPLEALGIWPTSEFRLSAADSSIPAIVFYAGALVAALAFSLGLPRWTRRHGPAVPLALLGVAAVYLGALAFGTVYTSAKALAVASPLVVLVALGGLLDQDGPPWRPGIRGVLALALATGAAFSSLLVLRQAPVAPDDHRDQLAELRPLVEGEKVLFLGRDNFVLHELRGSRPFVAVRNFYDPYYVQPNLRLERVFSKFDFDSVTAKTLERFRYVITTRAGYASGPPPAFRPLSLTDDYVLWERRGSVGARRTLAEADQPGAVLRCDGRRPSIGTAAVLEPAPGGPAASWQPAATIENGGSATQALRLRPGRWALSLQYDSTRPVTISAPGLEESLAANLDYRGSAPFWPAGEISVPPGQPLTVTATVEEPPPVGRLLGTDSVAHLGALAATRAGEGGPLPGSADLRLSGELPCRSYVDWYRTAE